MKPEKITIENGIIKQGNLEIKVSSLTLDDHGRILEIIGSKLCPNVDCDSYVTLQEDGEYCKSCFYEVGK